jgi:translation elongation factor EF-4
VGVVVLVRLSMAARKKVTIKLFSTNREYEIEKIGYLGLKFSPQSEMTCGEAGYIIPITKKLPMPE